MTINILKIKNEKYNFLEIKKVDNDIFLWELNNKIETISLKKATLNCDSIDWIEKYNYENEKGEVILINKIHSFDRGYIRTPIWYRFSIRYISKWHPPVPLYDLDGNYSFQGGYYDYEPDDEESLIDLYGDDILEELDNIGTDSSTVILSGQIKLEIK